MGDALGYPVEFLCEDTIREKYGAAGIQTLAQAGRPALISDDTQMTLFAANAIVYTSRQGGSLRENLWKAYREWLGTQGDTSRMDDPDHPSMWVYREPRMHARRAPGNSCLSAIRYSPHGGAMAKPVNNSKGCGTVMRAAPFGLASRTYGGAEEMAAADAALTHGHPLAWSSSELLAKLISWVVHEHPDRGTYRLEDVIPHLGKGRDPAAYALVNRAAALALDPLVSDLDGIHALGEGWVAEEALAIAVFCAVRYQDDFAAAIRAAVNHKGDSDSTGAICGNILGAWQGMEAVAAAFHLDDLELRDVIEKVAIELFEAVEGSDEKKPMREPGASISEPLKPLRSVGLLYTPLTKKAMQLCFAAHKNQFDKSGMPYVIHPLHLAEQMETEEEVCTALLHDVLEDAAYTLSELRKVGIPESVLEALRLLTRDSHTHYLDYVVRLRKNPLARRVKLADLAHNSNLNRLDYVTARDRRRVLKYRMAQAVLEDDQYDNALEHFRKTLPLSLDEPLYLSIFYDRKGVVEKYSIDIETAEDSHYELDPNQAEKLRVALNSDCTLPEALACWVEEGGGYHQVGAMLREYGITFQPFLF